MLKKWSEKLSEISCYYTRLLQAKICSSRWRFLRHFLSTSKTSRRSITAAKSKEKEKKGRRKKISKNWRRWLSRPKTQNFHFYACLSHNVVKLDAGGQQGRLLCCKHIFNRIKANLAEIQLKNHQNVQRMHFLHKVPGVTGLNRWLPKKLNLLACRNILFYWRRSFQFPVL